MIASDVYPAITVRTMRAGPATKVAPVNQGAVCGGLPRVVGAQVSAPVIPSITQWAEAKAK